MSWINSPDNAADAVTGERIFPRERVFDTQILNKNFSFDNSKNQLVKESTIVWLAEQAGFTVITSDAGDSGDSKNVDAGDVESRDGAPSTRKVKARGK